MSRWWRAYDEAVDDPKLQRLSPETFRGWFNLCCLTSANGGILPSMDDISFKLRMKPARAHKLLGDLRLAGLIDDDGEGQAAPHNWSGRQFKSDVTDPTNAERQRRYRSRDKAVTETVTPTVTDKRPDTEQRQNRTDNAPDGATTNGKIYEFEHGVIRLTPSDFAKWQKAYSHLDLAAELIALEPWAAQQERWFHAVSGALTKKNRELKARADARRAGGPQLPLTPAGNPWPEGIV